MEKRDGIGKCFHYSEIRKCRRSSSVVRVLAYHVKGPGFESRPGHCAAWIWVYYSCGSAASFGWDVKPRSSLCSTPNMDYKDPDITEEENL